jgi:two-component system, cell cycle sensor histidine kinase and response regulator CckA
MSRRQTILAVEDEEILLDLVKTLLEGEGYTVLTARDGEEALAIYVENHKEIAAVLSDMGLPMMSGWDLYLKMKEINPGVKVILATGYQTEAVKKELVELGAKDFIGKPYVWEGLVKRIREVIAAP